MTDQQKHLQYALEQQQSIAKEIEQLNNQSAIKKEVFFKLQGVIEYLTQNGVTIEQSTSEPEPKVEE